MRPRYRSAALLALLALGALALLWLARGSKVATRLAAAPQESGLERATPDAQPELRPAWDLAEPEDAAAAQTSGARRAAPAREVRQLSGRVLDERNDAPLEGVEMRAVGSGRLRRTATSAADGRFEFSLPADRRAVNLIVSLPEGWEASQTRRVVEFDAAATDEQVFRLRPRRAAIFIGRALDASTGEVLAHLELESPGRGARMRTDAQGEFRSREPWYLGPIRLSGLCDGNGVRSRVTQRSFSSDGRELNVEYVGEHGGISVAAGSGGWAVTSTTVLHEAAPEPVEVMLSVGPTFELDLTLPAGLELDSLHASLGAAGTLAALDRLSTSLAAVHAGAPPWVRFVAPCTSSVAGPPWRLEVGSRDGEWRGEALVDACVGRASGRVPIELQRCGKLEVELLDTAGRHLDQVDAVLVLDGSPERRGTLSRTGDGRDQSTRNLRTAAGLLPGTYRVVCRDREHLPLEQAVYVPAGTTTRIVLALTPLPVAGGLSGRLRSARGADGFVERVSLRSLDDSLPSPEAVAVKWTRDERGPLGEFHFTSLADAEYRIGFGETGGFDWLPAERVVRPRAQDLEWTLQDDVPCVSLQMDVLDGRTGANVRRARIELHSGGNTIRSLRSRSGHHVRLGVVARERTFRWSVSASGYEPAEGTQGAFRPSGRFDGLDLLRARVFLKPNP